MHMCINQLNAIVEKIGEYLKEFKLPEIKEDKSLPVIANADGVARCRFDLFVRYPENSNRRKKTFCYRGDYPDIQDPAKMLWSLVRMFLNKHNEFLLAELYDNTRQKSDPARTILRFKGNKILINRLKEYQEMLKDNPVPDWLK